MGREIHEGGSNNRGNVETMCVVRIEEHIELREEDKKT